jgi:thiol-disulfide isomerase/thioredoxin
MKFLGLAGLAALLVVPVARTDEPAARSAVSAEIPRSNDQSRRPEESIAKRYEQIRAEFEAKLAAQRSVAGKAESPLEKTAAAAKTISDLVVDYCRRMVDLAESSPDEPAARDALLWVLDNAGRGDVRADRDQFARAAALVVRHHGNDPEAVRFAVAPPNNPVTPRYEALLLGFYAAATGREAKGLARLALAQYLVNKAKAVVYARTVVGRPKRRYVSGGKVVREVDLTDEQYADHLALRQCDPEAIEAEAKRLFEEVIAEYSDVPNVTRRARELEALLREPAPARNGRPLTAKGRRGIEESLARVNKTLGQEAEDRLEAMLNLAVGKPAPEINGVDFDGKPLKLSDYRGKVVVLVFWGSWCSPCMALVPHERDLAARLKGKPFALLGVDCEDSRDTARAVMARERMTWPNWFDGAAHTGTIAKRYRVQSFPRIYVVDHRGVIRHQSGIAVGIDDIVDKLLEEMKQPASDHGASRPGSEKEEAPGA